MACIYMLFLMIHIFSYTSLLDSNQYAIYAESLKVFMGIILFILQGLSWYGENEFISIIFFIYLTISLSMTLFFINKKHYITKVI